MRPGDAIKVSPSGTKHDREGQIKKSSYPFVIFTCTGILLIKQG
jgi:hypothetical protein